MKALRIASRTSKLALAQTELIRQSLLQLYPELEIRLVKVLTRGDQNHSDFLHKMQEKGLFTSEVENALLDGRADIAVHSLKDLPITNTTELVVAAIPEREMAADVLVTAGHTPGLAELPAGLTVGTCSPRRIAQLRHLRPDLIIVPLRGNVETRLAKVLSGRIDAAIIAFAGLSRLGLAGKISAVLPPEHFLPAPGQGALAVQVRRQDTELLELVCRLDHKPTRLAVEAERQVLAATRAGCSTPLGAYARIVDERLVIDAMIAEPEGQRLIRRSASSPISQARICAENLARELLEAGGWEILKALRREGRTGGT
jgi:hydroxymethylbilane synthase